MPENLNLDKLAAQWAQKMVKDANNDIDKVNKKRVETLERLATKSLGVLQEQGVYAMMLFLFSRSSSDEQNVAPVIRAQLYKALKALPAFQNDKNLPQDDAKAEATLQFYTDNERFDLDTLLLVRDLYELTLIYVRYGSKAAKGTKNEGG